MITSMDTLFFNLWLKLNLFASIPPSTFAKAKCRDQFYYKKVPLKFSLKSSQ